MSEATLSIQRLPPELENIASEALTRLGIPNPGVWRSVDSQPVNFSLFNLATVNFFLDYVAKLEGYPDSGHAMGNTKFLNLPWWQTSIWVPVAFQPPKEPPVDAEGWPVFVGSCQGLLVELAEVQRMSDRKLGMIPNGYEQMRADYRAFLRSGFVISDERSLIQWVWRGLYDGAELATRGSALLLDVA